MSAHSATDWQWIPAYNLYFSQSTNTWAQPNPSTGEWTYLPGTQPQGTSARTEDGVVATGYQLATSDQAGEQGGIGNVGWALEADLADGATSNGPSETEARRIGDDAGSSNGVGPKLEDDANNESSTTKNSSREHQPDQPSYHTAAQPPPAQPKVLRLVLLSSSILPTDASSPKIAILDSRPSGYFLGRDRSPGKPVLRLKEMAVSKIHAMIWWGSRDTSDPGDSERFLLRDSGDSAGGEREKGFWIIDCGSTHGTFLLPPHASETPPTRLSEARQSSLPYKLDHLSRLTIGSTTFECHIHQDWPCDICALHHKPPIPVDDPSASSSSTAAATATAARADARASPVEMPNADQWNSTESRRVAMTSEAKKVDQARRAGIAMRSLKARYFGNTATGGGKGARAGGAGGRG